MDPERLFLLPATLLALAAFLPAAVTIWGGDRESLGVRDAELSRALIAIYLLGAFVTALLAPKIGRAEGIRILWRGAGARILWVVVLYWVTAALSNLNAGLPMGRLSFLSIPVIFFVAWRYRPSYQQALNLLGWVCLGVCAASLLLALDNPANAFTHSARIVHVISSDRLAGIFEQPNGLGLFAGIGVLLWWSRKGWLRVFGVSVCGFVLAVSDARTTWFACAIAAIVLVVARRHKARPFSLRRFVLGAGLLALVASLIFTFATPEEHGHITFNGRTEVWQFVGEKWTESPIIGHGPNVWPSLLAAKQVPDWAGQAHDQFLETLFTTGLVGVGLLLLLVWYWTAANLRSARDGYLLPLALEALMVVNALFESPLSLGGVNDKVWLLSILLFLLPAGNQLLPGASDDPGDPSDQKLRSEGRRLGLIGDAPGGVPAKPRRARLPTRMASTLLALFKKDVSDSATGNRRARQPPAGG